MGLKGELAIHHLLVNSRGVWGKLVMSHHFQKRVKPREEDTSATPSDEGKSPRESFSKEKKKPGALIREARGGGGVFSGDSLVARKRRRSPRLPVHRRGGSQPILREKGGGKPPMIRFSEEKKGRLFAK